MACSVPVRRLLRTHDASCVQAPIRLGTGVSRRGFESPAPAVLPTLGLMRGLAPLAPPLLSQLALTVGGFWLLATAGTPDPIARVAGVLVGLAVASAVLLLRASGPLLEARSLAVAVRQSS